MLGVADAGGHWDRVMTRPSRIDAEITYYGQFFPVADSR